MTISALTTRLIRFPSAPRYRNGIVPLGRPDHWEFPLLTVHTTDGLEGHSSAYGPQSDGAALTTLLHDSYFPVIRGRDPLHSEAIWQCLWARQRHLYNQTDSLLGVLDVAIWDLRGKMLGQPIAALLGQQTDRRPAYLSARSEADSAEEIAAEVKLAQQAGYHGYKLQLRDGPAADLPRLRAAREAAGPDYPLMQDPNAAYSLAEALSVGRVLDELRYHWFEEPLPETQLDRYSDLVAALRTPILGGETVRLTDLPNFLTGHRLTMARGDVLIKGGITGLRKAMATCELFGYNLEVHTANSPLLDVANLHVACAARNTTMVEVHHPIFRFGLKKHPFDVGRDGMVMLPAVPGLGVELDWDWIDNHTAALRQSP